MSFHLENLTERELIDLNRQIVERLGFLQQSRAHQAMLQFRIGDRVTFNPDGHGAVIGMLTRYNKKSVTVITEDGQHWNVAPGFLQKAAAGIAGQTQSAGRKGKPSISNVVPLKPK